MPEAFAVDIAAALDRSVAKLEKGASDEDLAVGLEDLAAVLSVGTSSTIPEDSICSISRCIARLLVPAFGVARKPNK